MNFTPLTHYSLLSHNTFGISAFADYFAEYHTISQLQEIVSYKNRHLPSVSFLHIGGGSNLLFLNDYHGFVLHSAIKGIEVLDETSTEVLVRVGASIVWDDWVAYSLSQGWYGLENLSAIPGEVGASAVQNIGAYGSEVAQFIHQVHTVSLADGSLHCFDLSSCEYGYRHSLFKNADARHYAVTHVTFRLSRRFVPNFQYKGLKSYLQQTIGGDLSSLTAQAMRTAVIATRNSKLPDPKELGNAGSFFMNPVVPNKKLEQLRQAYPSIPSYPVSDNTSKIPAAWLIEQSGWKGRGIGPASTYHKQPLILVNTGGATGADIYTLCQQIQHDVAQQFGIHLSPEVCMIS